jgi:hypothetical protein
MHRENYDQTVNEPSVTNSKNQPKMANELILKWPRTLRNELWNLDFHLPTNRVSVPSTLTPGRNFAVSGIGSTQRSRLRKAGDRSSPTPQRSLPHERLLAASAARTRTQTDTHRHTQTHTDTHIHTQTHTHNTDTHTYTQPRTDTHKHAHRHTQTRTETHTKWHTQTHKHAQRHTQSDTHTDTQTHKLPKKKNERW